MAVNGELVNKLLAIFLALFFQNANAQFKELELKDVQKYHVCESGWLSEIGNIGCDENLTKLFLSPSDDRVANRYIPYRSNAENIIAITPYSDVETILEIQQEVPLEYTISTYNNNFYGVFYSTNENQGSGIWYVKCNSTEKKCLISSEILTFEVDKESVWTNLKNQKSFNYTSMDGIDQAIGFSKWAISMMK